MEALRNRLGEAANRVENKALRKGGKVLADAQKSKVAVSGKESVHMRDDINVSSVKKQDGQKVVEVGAGKNTSWRAHLLEFGTQKITAQPFIYPAFHETKDEIVHTLADELRKGLRE